MAKWMPLIGTPLAVRWDMLDEAQALMNHGQTLETLMQRGGLSPVEALAIARLRRFERLPEINALKMLAGMPSNTSLSGLPLGKD